MLEAIDSVVADRKETFGFVGNKETPITTNCAVAIRMETCSASSAAPCAAAESRKENSAPGMVISGAGATFNNVIFNVFPTPKPRMSLKLKCKKVTENHGALSQLSSLALCASQVASS